MQFFLKHLFCFCSAALWIVFIPSFIYIRWFFFDKVSDVMIWSGLAWIGIFYLYVNALVVLIYALYSKTLCYEKHADALIATLVKSVLLILCCIFLPMLSR